MSEKKYFDFSNYETHKGFNIYRPLCNLCCKTRVKLEVEGLENLDREDGFIIAANHSIIFDPVFIQTACKDKLFHFVAKYEAKYDTKPVSFAALAYDAVYIVKQAIEAAQSVEYDDVVKALTNGTFSGLVTSSSGFKFVDGNPEKAATVITFKDGKEVEAK